MKCTVGELTEIFNTAMLQSQSQTKKNELATQNISLMIKPMTEVFQPTSIHSLDYINLKYKVQLLSLE